MNVTCKVFAAATLFVGSALCQQGPDLSQEGIVEAWNAAVLVSACHDARAWTIKAPDSLVPVIGVVVAGTTTDAYCQQEPDRILFRISPRILVYNEVVWQPTTVRYDSRTPRPEGTIKGRS